MTRDDWARRFYGPHPAREQRMPDRAADLRHVRGVAADMVALGEYLYRDLHVADIDGFDGTAGFILANIPRPRGSFKSQISWALICYAGHTNEQIDEWIEVARSVTITGYVNWLKRQGVKPSMITLNPPPYVGEAMRSRRVSS